MTADVIVEQEGVRVNETHWARVRAARLALQRAAEQRHAETTAVVEAPLGYVTRPGVPYTPKDERWSR